LNSVSCTLCKKDAQGESSYCKNHNEALIEIRKAYPKWCYALENISWERYLETIIRLKETGELAKAVAVEELRLQRSTAIQDVILDRRKAQTEGLRQWESKNEFN
jgi:hypothetical protein